MFRQVCREQGARLTEVDFSRLRLGRSRTSGGSRFDFEDPDGRLHLASGRAAISSANAAAGRDRAWRCCRRRGWAVDGGEHPRGDLPPPGGPDGSSCCGGDPAVAAGRGPQPPRHGRRGPETLAAACSPGPEDGVACWACMADKDVDRRADAAAASGGAGSSPSAPHNPRALDGRRSCARRLTALGCPSPGLCLRGGGRRTAALAAAGPHGAVCALGSLYHRPPPCSRRWRTGPAATPYKEQEREPLCASRRRAFSSAFPFPGTARGKVQKPAAVCLQIVYIHPLTMDCGGGKLALALREREC